MRLVLKSLLILALLAPWPPALPLRAQVLDPCSMALTPGDLPAELVPEQSGQQSLDLSDDPSICERVFHAQSSGPSGLTLVRSLILVTPSERQAADDFDEYRELMIEAGWDEVEPQPVGDLGTVFVGSDERAGIFSVQQLFRRGAVVATVEATGPRLQAEPDVVLEYARIVDRRMAIDLGGTFGNPIRGGSIWPAVAAPTVVSEVRLSGAPLVGQSLQLGGFSGLAALDPEGRRFVAVTDRGPGFESGSGANRKLIMPLPAFTPSILRLELRSGQLKIVERIGLKLGPGYTDPRTGTAFVTGLPNSDADVAAFDQYGKNRWGADPYGLDPEGIAVDPRDGSFWLVEEYGPSILHVAPDGTIEQRLVPAGLGLQAPGQNVREILPPELAKRKANRGFEGVAISPDGKWLFAIMQSPLPNPDRAAGEASRTIRLLTVNLSGAEPVVDGVFVYQAEAAAAVGVASQDQVQVSDLAAVSGSRLLVTERDNQNGGSFKMVYRIDLNDATNLLGRGSFDGKTLEQLDDAGLAAQGITPLAKQPVANLAELGWRFDEPEGLAVVDESTIAIVADNDYSIGAYDPASGKLTASGISTRLSLIHLPGSLVR